jgi:hypothetical protein
MFNSLSEDAQKAAQFESPVTAIFGDAPTSEYPEGCMRISINGTPSSKRYSAIISTAPLPRLSIMNLNGVDIGQNYAQWSAIRELQYGPAIKIGMRFTTPWWGTKLKPPIRGGQSYTDVPLRTM